MISVAHMNTFHDFKTWSCFVCQLGVCWLVGSNIAICSSYNHWGHGKCSHTHGELVEDANFRCSRYSIIISANGHLCKLILIDNHKIKTFDSGDI